MPKVQVLRPFNLGPAGPLTEPGSVIEVEDTRARELAAHGLAKAVPGASQKLAEKAAPEPENKMAPEPKNKALPRHKGRGGGQLRG